MNAAGFLKLFREADFGLIDFTGLVIVNHCHKQRCGHREDLHSQWEFPAAIAPVNHQTTAWIFWM